MKLFVDHYPSLFIVASAHDAIFYRATEEGLQEIDRLHNDHREHMATSDNEGFFASRARGVGTIRSGIPGVVDTIELEERRKHFREVGVRVKALCQQEHFVHVVCSVPGGEKNHLDKELTGATNGVAAQYTLGNFIHEPRQRHEALFHAALKPA